MVILSINPCLYIYYTLHPSHQPHNIKTPWCIYKHCTTSVTTLQYWSPIFQNQYLFKLFNQKYIDNSLKTYFTLYKVILYHNSKIFCFHIFFFLINIRSLELLSKRKNNTAYMWFSFFGSTILFKCNKVAKGQVHLYLELSQGWI